MSFDYYRYMASREWALKKEAVKERSGGICERCKTGPHQNTHHLTYEHLGDERLDELQGVCRACHEWLSGKREDDPAAINPDTTSFRITEKEIIRRMETYGMKMTFLREHGTYFCGLLDEDGCQDYLIDFLLYSEPNFNDIAVIEVGDGVWAHCWDSFGGPE